MKRGIWIWLLTCSVAHPGAVYKWTDDKGRVHYGDKPVAQAEKLDMAKKDPVLAARRAAENVQLPANVEERAAACQRKKDQLFTYENAANVTEVDSLGNRKEFTSVEKQTLVERTRQQVEELCSPAVANADNETE